MPVIYRVKHIAINLEGSRNVGKHAQWKYIIDRVYIAYKKSMLYDINKPCCMCVTLMILYQNKTLTTL